MLSKKTKNKIKLLILLIIISSFLIGFIVGKINYNDPQDKKYDMSLMWEIKDILNEKFIDTRIEKKDEITKNDHIFGAISGFVNSFRDPYTTFLPPEENKELMSDISGEFVGVGMEITNINGYLTVVSPLPDTPAYKAGILPKDIIIEIEGEDTIMMPSSTAVKLIRGEKGKKVKLKVMRMGENEPLDIEIIRDIIKIPTIKTYNKDGVFVIKIYSFTKDSHSLFLQSLNKFLKSKTDKLIIDVRGNPGGHLFAAVYIAGLFLEEGKIILTEDYGGKKENTILRSGDFHNKNENINLFTDKLKLAVLTDGGSASASEILAGTLADHKKAILFGTTTFGKGTVQELIPLRDGTSLKVTIAKWILPNGEWISHKGILPDIEIKISPEEFEEFIKKGSFTDDIDPQLNRAIKEINKLKSMESFQDFIEKKRKEKKEKKEKKKKEIIKEIFEK